MKKELFKFLVLLIVALGSAPAYSAYWNWSRTASTNATADPSINWAEGQSPSSVNDSARAMMARSAEQRDDISGALVTAGTGNAYTVTTNQGLQTPTPTDGQFIAITVHATNVFGATGATLQSDGGTAYVIQSAAGVPVADGTLIAGSPYSLRFSVANSAWMLRNFYGNPFSVPLGAMLPYTGSAAPNSNFVLPFGQCISRTTYAAYFALVGTTYGACDGVSTFGVADMRGQAPFGKDDMGGVAANRLTGTFGCNGSTLGAGCGLQSLSIGVTNIPAYTLPNSLGISDTTNYTVNNGNGLLNAAAGSLFGGGPVGATQNVTLTKTGSVSITGGVTSGGSGTLAGIIPPARIVNYILRVN